MFLPLGDDNSQRTTTPFVVWGLFAMNCAVWMLQLSQGESFTNGWSTVPYELTHGVDLVGTQTIHVGGDSIGISLYQSPSPIWLTAFSAMFMHGSWEHIIGNMTYLLIFADQIEDELGHFRFLIFYILCGLAAAFAHVVADPDSVIPCLGASGAIAGVLGAYLILHPRNRVHVLWLTRYGTTDYLPASIVLGMWIVLQLISQVSVIAGAPSGVAYMAHIGGFFAGAVFLFPLRFGRRRSMF